MKNSITILFFSFFLILIIQSCKKDNEPNPVPFDYRSAFTGDFQFTVCNNYWSLGLDTFYVTRDTEIINGSISTFRYNQLLIKYDTSEFSGLWLTDTADCSSGWALYYIADSLINNPPDHYNSFFVGYYEGWVSPVFHEDSIMDLPCVPFQLSGGVHIGFGGYFINTDSLYLYYTMGGLGAGSFRYVYGRRL